MMCMQIGAEGSLEREDEDGNGLKTYASIPGQRCIQINQDIPFEVLSMKTDLALEFVTSV